MTDERQEHIRGVKKYSGNKGTMEVETTDLQGNEASAEEAAAWKNKYIQLLSDLENTKKRLARSAAQDVEADRKSLLRDMLPVADGLDLALLHLSDEEDSHNILSGLELIRNILDKFFSKYEVTVIEAWGKPFNPELHDAMGVVPHDKFPPHTVVRVEQKGYLYREELLRPARVLVVK